MKKIALALLLLLPAQPTLAAQNMDIAAVVGGEAISSYDVNARMRFIIATAKLSDTPEVVQRLKPQVIRTLIDERMQLAEAAKNDINIGNPEIAQAISGIEHDRDMTPGAIDEIMAQNNVPKDTFTQQIRAQLAWHRLLMKKIRPQIHISEEEIQRTSRKIAVGLPKQGSASDELQIAVISLPVDKQTHEVEVKRAADKLVKEVRGGASFEEVSRQFRGGAANTGTFWVRPQQLDPIVARALGAATKGTITEPLRTPEGFTIVKVYDRRSKAAPAPPKDMEVTLKEILLKLKPSAETQEASVLLQIGEEVAKHPGSCSDKNVAGIDNLEGVDIVVNFRTSQPDDLPPALRIIANTLKVGDISTPFASDEGLRLYMLCDRKEATTKTPDREQVYNVLVQQKMELEAQKYMRNLRRDMFIEVR